MCVKVCRYVLDFQVILKYNGCHSVLYFSSRFCPLHIPMILSQLVVNSMGRFDDICCKLWRTKRSTPIFQQYVNIFE